MNNRYLLTSVCFLFSLASFSQIVQNGGFKEVTQHEGKVVFQKEIQQKRGMSDKDNYIILKNWAKENYGKDPFISSLRYDAENYEILAKSRIELLLPPNGIGIREKIVMRYRVNSFLFRGKCVLEVTELSYLYDNYKNTDLLPRASKAEHLITDEAIRVEDKASELRRNTRKGTLYFLNELAETLEKQFK